MEQTIIKVDVKNKVAIPLEVLKESVIHELHERVLRYVNSSIKMMFPRYDDYIDVETTASSPVAPAKWKKEAQAIAVWFYDIFQRAEAQEAAINAMTTEEEVLEFYRNLHAWIESLPKLEL